MSMSLELIFIFNNINLGEELLIATFLITPIFDIIHFLLYLGLNAQPEIQIFNGFYLRYLDLLKQIDVIIILVGSGVLVLY